MAFIATGTDHSVDTTVGHYFKNLVQPDRGSAMVMAVEALIETLGTPPNPAVATEDTLLAVGAFIEALTAQNQVEDDESQTLLTNLHAIVGTEGDESQALLTALTAQNLTESDETQVSLVATLAAVNALTALTQAEDDQTQVALELIEDAIADSSDDELVALADILGKIGTEGDETQALLTAILADSAADAIEVLRAQNLLEDDETQAKLDLIKAVADALVAQNQLEDDETQAALVALTDQNQLEDDETQAAILTLQTAMTGNNSAVIAAIQAHQAQDLMEDDETQASLVLIEDAVGDNTTAVVSEGDQTQAKLDLVKTAVDAIGAIGTAEGDETQAAIAALAVQNLAEDDDTQTKLDALVTLQTAFKAEAKTEDDETQVAVDAVDDAVDELKAKLIFEQDQTQKLLEARIIRHKVHEQSDNYAIEKGTSRALIQNIGSTPVKVDGIECAAGMQINVDADALTVNDEIKVEIEAGGLVRILEGYED